MATSAKQNQTEPARPIGKCRVAKPGDAGGKTATSQPGVHAADADVTLVDWCDEGKVRPKVVECTLTEQRQEDLQSTEYIGGRTLKRIGQLEQIADLALRPLDDLPLDYDLATKMLVRLVKLSSVGPQGVDPHGPGRYLSWVTFRSCLTVSSGQSNWAARAPE